MLEFTLSPTCERVKPVGQGLPSIAVYFSGKRVHQVSPTLPNTAGNCMTGFKHHLNSRHHLNSPI